MARIDLILNIKNKLNKALGKADAQVDKFKTDAQRKLDSLKMPRAVSGKNQIFAKMGRFDADTLRAVESMRREVPVLDRALDLASNKFILAGAGAMALGGGIAYATKLSHDWEQSMAKVNVTAELSHENLGILSDMLRDMGRDAPIDIMQIPEAFNTIISAAGDVEQSLVILPLALKASKAGFTDLKLVADAAVSSISSSGKDPAKVFDILFATMNKGKAEFKDIANYLPKLIPTSRALGWSLEQTAGSWALLTAKGLQSEQATTGFQNLVKAMGEGRIIKSMKGKGINIFEDNGDIKNVLDIVTMFKSKMQGLTDKQRISFMDSIGLDQEASMALNIMLQNANDLEKTIKYVGKDANHLELAFIHSATSTDLMVKIANRFKLELMNIGDVVLQMIKPALTWVYTNLDTISSVVKSIGVGLAFFGAAWVAMKAPMLIIQAIQMRMLVLQTLMNLMNPLGWIAIGITVLSFLWFKFDKFRFAVMGIWEAIKMGAKILWNNLKTVFTGVLDMVGGVAKAMLNMMIGNIGAIKDNIDQVKKGYRDIQDNFIGSEQKHHAIKVAYQYGYKMQKDSELKKSLPSFNEDDEDKDTTNDGGGLNPNSLGSRTQSVQDRISSSTKSITINLNGSLNSGDMNVNVTELNKDTDIFELERIFTEMFMRVLRNFD